MNSVLQGFTLILSSLTIFALIWLVLHWVPKMQSRITPVSLPPVLPDMVDTNDAAVLLVEQGGGRVCYVNEQAREWFGNFNEEPNLERLAKRIRPGEVFLGLCATQSQARFTLDGRFVEGTSYLLPPNARNGGQKSAHGAIVVTLRRPQVTAITPKQTEVSEQALSIITELSQKMAANLDVEKTLYSILESVNRLVVSDLAQISIWDSEHLQLDSYRIVGSAGIDEHLEKFSDLANAEDGFASFLIQHRSPLLIENIDRSQDILPNLAPRQYPFNAYLGIPLLVAGELIGTVELASISKAAFNENDLNILKMLSGQAAIALNNAILFRAEQQRVLELTGLSRLASAVGALRDQQDLFERLVESIFPLVPVNALGFLIYEENQRLLRARVPFIGIPDQLIDLFQFPIPIGSPAEEIWLSQQVISSSYAPEDPTLAVLGLDHAAQAAGIIETVLVPLKSISGPLGYLQIADKRDGTGFGKDDLRLLSIIASQVATIIENATLLRESQDRVQRSEAMRRIASLTGSMATLDEILTYSLRELARLLNADVAAIFLVDENLSELRVHQPSLYGIPDNLTGCFESISMTDPVFRETVTSSLDMLLDGNCSEEAEISPWLHPILAKIGVHSVIDVPLVIRNQGVGEILLGSHVPDYFDRNDLILASTTSSQLASAIEKANLSSLTDENLQRRVEQLVAITRFSRALNTTFDLHQLIQIVIDEAIRTTQASCGTILLFDLPSMQAGQPCVSLFIGDPPETSLGRLEKKVLETGDPLIIDDLDNSEIDLLGERLMPPHAGIKSEMVVPVRYQDHIAGLILLHAQETDQFDNPSLEIVQSLSVQAAIAVGNVKRYQDQAQHLELLNRRVEAMSHLVETSRTFQTDLPLGNTLEEIAFGIQNATSFESVLISVYNSQTQHLERVAGAGIPPAVMDELRSRTQPWQLIEQLLLPEFRISQSFFIPGDQNTIVSPELHWVQILEESDESDDRSIWNSADLLLVPLMGATGQPLGLIRVDGPRNKLRPDKAMIESLELYASQAALLIETLVKIQNLNQRSMELEQEVERAQNALNAMQDNLPVLLHKDLEQTLALHNLNQRTRRLQAGLDIADMLYQHRDREKILRVVADETLIRLEMDSVLAIEPSQGGMRLIYSCGEIPSGSNPETLLGQRNPLRSSLRGGRPILVSNLEENQEWQNTPLLQALEARAFLSLPVLVEGESKQPAVNSVFLLVSRSVLPSFTLEDEQLYVLMMRQVSIALNNLKLLQETNRRLAEVDLLLEFSRNLGSLDPAAILQNLVESSKRAVPVADACLVALWDSQQTELVPQAAAGYSDNSLIQEIHYKSGESLAGKVFENSSPLRVDEVNFTLDYNLSSEQLLIYHKANRGRLPVSCLVLPIQAQETCLGVIVLDNFTTLAAFTPEDQALVNSLGRQTALTLENARLYQASEQRAGQLQALTQVAGTITSSLQSDELIHSLLDQARSIIPYDTGTLWLRQSNMLMIRAARGFEDSEEREGISIAISDSRLLNEMIQTSQPISVGNVRGDERFSSIMESRYLSWLGIPLLSKGEVVGVIALEKTEPNFYTSEHIQAVVTFASQAAVALENANLYEESVRRASELDQRSRRLALLNRLSTELSGSLDLEHIMSVTLSEVHQAIRSTVVSIILFDEHGQPYLHAEEPTVLDSLPELLPGSQMFERLRDSLGAFISEDVHQEILLETLHDFFDERGAKSLLATSLATGNQLHGVLLLTFNELYRFSADEIELSRTIGNQVSVAIQNARLFTQTERLFAETQRRSAELGVLFDLGVNITQVFDQTRLMDIVFDYLRDLIGADSAGMVLIRDEETLVANVVEHGERIDPVTFPRKGNSLCEYVLDTEQALLVADIQSGDANPPVLGYSAGEGMHSWLGVPLMVRGTTMGVLSIQSDGVGKFNESHLRLLSQIGNQLSIALDNSQLFKTVQNYASDLEQRVNDRTRQLAREHHRIQSLLSIITELSASLDMELVLNRTLAVINETIEAEHSLIMIVHPDEQTLFQRASLGYTIPTPEGGQASRFKINEGLAGWVITHRTPVLIEDLWEDARWEKRDDQTRLHRSAMAVPLMMGEETLGALLLFHRKVNQFTMDQLELVTATAKQIAVTINNAQLYSLIRDQAERLGDMLRTQHIETSRSQAILEAVADGVLVTDAHRQITLFNDSAEKILDMSRGQVVGNSLENFIGLFGKAGQKWVQTIRKWSEAPAAYESEESYMEQIELDNRRVVAVHLSPVRLRNDFLGTVSIFRDITHLIEVDRLKSEFVATVSHELRTPMTSIKGYVEVLLMGAAGELNSQQYNFLEIVKNNTERLAILVNDLLDVSRIEAGKVELMLQPLDLRKIAERVIDTIKRRIQGDHRPMEIQLEVQDDLPMAYGDPERVLQILDNLVDNSYQYTPEKGHIWIRIYLADREIQIDVKDDGIGILEEDKRRVFERFYRGEDPLVLATSGTGLGLSIVQTLVEMHNGRIWIDSTGIPGEGSTFSFTLPRYNPEVEDTTEA